MEKKTLEQAVLLCILLGKEETQKFIFTNSKEEFFADEANQYAYRSLRALYYADGVVDAVMARRIKRLSEGYWEKIMATEALLSNADEYLEALKEDYRLRVVRDLAVKLRVCNTADEAIAMGEDVFLKVNSIGKDVLADQATFVETAKRAFAENEKCEGISLKAPNLKNLNWIIPQFRTTDYTIISADTSVGKTTFALNLALDFAKQGKHGLFISYEMSADEMTSKMLALETQIPVLTILYNKAIGENRKKLDEALEKIKEYKIFWDTSNGNVLDIKTNINKHMLKHGKLDFIFIDYLQKIRMLDYKKSKYENDELTCGEIQRMAKTLKIPIFALSQYSRTIVAGNSKDISSKMHKLKGGSHIEQDADRIILLEQKDKSPSVENQTIVIAKQRMGSIGEIESYLHKSIGMYNIADAPEYFRRSSF